MLGGAAIIATGAEHGSRVSGFRVVGDAQAPLVVGVRAAGKTVLDDLDVSGTLLAGVALSGGAHDHVLQRAARQRRRRARSARRRGARRAQRVRAERLAGAERDGAPPAPPECTPPPAGTDIMLLDAPRVTFVGNVISGEPAQRVRGLGADQAARFRESNIVLPPPPRPHVLAPRRPGARPVTPCIRLQQI